jgi:hypothetical protein
LVPHAAAPGGHTECPGTPCPRGEKRATLVRLRDDGKIDDIVALRLGGTVGYLEE